MPQRRLLLATNNAHKVFEMRALLGDIPFDLVTPHDLGLSLEVEEPFATYLENATQKARTFAEVSGELALADDSGLEIDAMDGAPGVFSARFGAPDMPYPQRFALIEERLAGVPPARRTARFRCVLVLAAPPPDARHTHTEGVVAGQIAPVAQGAAGFGYDPIFWLPDQGVTMADLSPAAKDAISHRGQAARAMAEILRTWK